METMTMAEVAKAILEHFDGNRAIAAQGILSFLDEHDDEEGGTYDVGAVQEWLNR